MKFADFISSIDADYTYSRITEADIKDYEEAVGLHFGTQLKEYVLEYGYLGFKHMELFGICDNMGMKSDLITRTLKLHSRFEQTANLIAVEDQGDGDFYLVDSEDNVYRFVPANKQLTPQNIKLFDYITARFSEFAD